MRRPIFIQPKSSCLANGLMVTLMALVIIPGDCILSLWRLEKEKHN